MKPTRGPTILASLLLSACVNGSLAPSGAGSASADPSIGESSPEPPATVGGTAPATPDAAGPLSRDGIAEVVTDDLVVRSLPEISARSTVAPTALSTGHLLYVLDGPVAADGYEWYQVAPFDEFLSDVASEAPRLGWVAAGRPDEPWIAPWAGDCPEPTLDEIRWRSPYLTLACFGDEQLTLQGTLGDCGDIYPGILEPMWLANHHCFLLPSDLADGLFSGLVVRQEGEILDSLAKGAAVRVLGHFDHPAARTCVEHTLQGEEPTPPELLVLYCRSQFVATDVTTITAP
jgi:hypothetical protein